MSLTVGVPIKAMLITNTTYKILKEEFEITMALMGTATVNDINKEHILHK